MIRIINPGIINTLGSPRNQLALGIRPGIVTNQKTAGATAVAVSASTTNSPSGSSLPHVVVNSNSPNNRQNSNKNSDRALTVMTTTTDNRNNGEQRGQAQNNATTSRLTWHNTTTTTNNNATATKKSTVVRGGVNQYVAPHPPEELNFPKNWKREHTFVCKECNDTFLYRSSLRLHLERRSMLVNYFCRPCNKKLAFVNK